MAFSQSYKSRDKTFPVTLPHSKENAIALRDDDIYGLYKDVFAAFADAMNFTYTLYKSGLGQTG